jgi:hypothetical protein
MSQVNALQLYTVLGDVIGSRKIADQAATLEQVWAELKWVNGHLPTSFPLKPSIGDEFQGAYTELGDALLATTLIALRLKGALEIRFGIGWGLVEIVNPDQAPVGQSGYGWWNAREAIEIVATIQSGAQGWPAAMRSRFVGNNSIDGVVNAFLLCRDQVLATMDKKDARVTLALFLNEPQAQVADELKLAQPTISNRQRRRGASTLVRAHQLLGSQMGARMRGQK